MQKEPVAVSTIDVKFSALWTYFEQYPRCRMGSSRLLRMGSRWRNKFQCRSSRKLRAQTKKKLLLAKITCIFGAITYILRSNAREYQGEGE